MTRWSSPELPVSTRLRDVPKPVPMDGGSSHAPSWAATSSAAALNRTPRFDRDCAALGQGQPHTQKEILNNTARAVVWCSHKQTTILWVSRERQPWRQRVVLFAALSLPSPALRCPCDCTVCATRWSEMGGQGGGGSTDSCRQPCNGGRRRWQCQWHWPHAGG